MGKRAMVMVAVLLFGAAAVAQTTQDPAIVEARQHYQSGLAHFNLQEYAQAITEFESAYRLKPDPVFLYNLAQAYRLSDNSERALYFYRAYLRSSPDAPNRSEVEGRIASLEKLVSDKKSVAVPPDHTLAPGEKPSAATAPATTSPASAPVASPTPAASVAAATPSRTTVTERTPIYKKWWLWTIVGVVAAGAAVGLAVGLTQSGPSFDAGLGTVGPAALREVLDAHSSLLRARLDPRRGMQVHPRRRLCARSPAHLRLIGE